MGLYGTMAMDKKLAVQHLYISLLAKFLVENCPKLELYLARAGSAEIAPVGPFYSQIEHEHAFFGGEL